MAREEAGRSDGPPRAPARRGVVLAAAAALAPLAAGALADVVLRATGHAARTGLALSAVPGDWSLLLGALASAPLALAVGVGAGRDRAARRQLRAAAVRAAEERRTLLARLDHELKNPLMAMRAALANATAPVPGGAGPGGGWAAADDGEAQRGLRSIEEQVLRLARLLADLRKIADVQAGAVDRLPVDVRALLEEAVEVVAESPDAAGRDLKVDVPRAPWPLPRVLGDEDLLSLAVVNLLDNAVKYTPAGGAIEVRAREASGQVVIEVADTGPGIDPGDLPHIWEELYRSPRARAVPGSGLGLPLVKAVVERHGGAVGAESRLGHGTAVRIHLPAAPAEG